MSTETTSQLSVGNPTRPPLGLVVCGPCACGKSEIASALAKHFNVPYVDADSYHSEENIKKMSNGIPLTDDDRQPWLLTVRKEMIVQRKKDLPDEKDSPRVAVVAACSALKRKYRNILRGEEDTTSPENKLTVIFVFLKCSENVLQKRLNERQGHFMKGNMLSSQLATLELPESESEQNHAIIVNGDAQLEDVVEESVRKLQTLSLS